MKIIFHKNFDKQFGKLRANEKKKARERLQLFLENPFSPILENHPLKGKYNDYRSINITGDFRAIYKFLNENECIFVDVDTHSNLYS
ncbi:MAG: type II toxin-antitoxin system mRNA interferase toxin, RelE/StbE family [bacterium]|nr:type II toxin-antitoxin system mRNA interferase toxin, RelE/StbE family [bacterium]